MASSTCRITTERSIGRRSPGPGSPSRSSRRRRARHLSIQPLSAIAAVPYHFIDNADADRQAGHFIEVTGLAAGQPAMIDWESAAAADAVVAFGLAVADTAARDPVAYYGFVQLRQAIPVLSRWPLMLP